MAPLRLVLASAAAALVTGQVTLAAWSFDSVGNTPTYAQSMTPDAGWSSATTPVMSTTGATGGLISPASTGFYYTQTVYSPMVSNHFYTSGWNTAAASVTWCFSAAGFANLQFTGLVRGGTSAPQGYTLSYSLSGAAFVLVSNLVPPSGTYATTAVYLPTGTATAGTLTLPSAVDNAVDLCVKLAPNPLAVSGTSSVTLDNIIFTGSYSTNSATPTTTPSGTATPTNTASGTVTPAVTVTPATTVTPTPTGSPVCPASYYSLYPSYDVVGDAPIASSVVPSERECAVACCSSPSCDAYSYFTGGLAPASMNCFLLGNVTGVNPNHVFNSGVRTRVLG